MYKRQAAVPGGFQGGDHGRADSVVLEFADGVDGGAGRRGDVLAEFDGVFAAVAEHHGGADGGLDDQVVGLVPGQAEEDASVGHRLDEEEEVGRAGAGEGGGGVLLGLGDAEGLADGAEDFLGVGQVSGGGVGAGGDDGHGLVDEGGGVRHDPYDGGAGRQALLEVRGGDAGGAADDQAVGGDVRGELGQEGAHVLGLDGEDQGVGGLGGLGVADRLDAVALAELGGAFLAAGGDQEVGGGPAAADHSAEEGFADFSGAEDGDLLGHGAGSPSGVGGRVPWSSLHRGAREGGCGAGRRGGARPAVRYLVRLRSVAAPRVKTRRAQRVTTVVSRRKAAVMWGWVRVSVMASTA